MCCSTLRALTVAITGLPEEDAEAAQASESDEGAADVALAMAFMAGKRTVCTDALQHVGGRIKSLQDGDTKATLRGEVKGRAASGVRKKSARSGAAKTNRPKPSGFAK